MADISEHCGWLCQTIPKGPFHRSKIIFCQTRICLGYTGDVSPNKLNMLVQGVGVNFKLHQLILSMFVFNTIYHIPACMWWTFLRGQSSTESLSPLYASAYYKIENNTIIIHQIFDKNKKRYSKPQKVSFQRLISGFTAKNRTILIYRANPNYIEFF